MKSDYASELFGSGYNCAQSVALAFAEKYGADKEFVAKAAAGLGGGLQMGEACGALSGAVLVIGLAFGQTDADDVGAKQQCYAKTKVFAEKFLEVNGCLTCRDLLDKNVNASGDEQRNINKKNYCSELVKRTAQVLTDMGY